MAQGGPFQPIVGPAPEPAPFGLLSSVRVIEGADEHWGNGFIYFSESCNFNVKLISICSSSVSATAINAGVSGQQFKYLPFEILADDSCTTFGGEAWDRKQRAVDKLEAATPKAVEYEFWTGALAKLNDAFTGDPATDGTRNRYLASSNSVDVTPGAAANGVKVRYGLAALEKALGDCGAGLLGTIHVTRDVGSALALVLTERDGKLYTKLGNQVIVGTGYTGSGPSGTIPATGVWMYATGPVEVRLGAPTTFPGDQSQAVDSSVNTEHWYAGRVAAVSFDGCCAFAAHVDPSLDLA